MRQSETLKTRVCERCIRYVTASPLIKDYGLTVTLLTLSCH